MTAPNKVDQFIAEHGLDRVITLVNNAPEWAKAIDVNHARKRFALNKEVNTYSEESITQMKKRHVDTDNYLSLENLKKCVGEQAND